MLAKHRWPPHTHTQGATLSEQALALCVRAGAPLPRCGSLLCVCGSGSARPLMASFIKREAHEGEGEEDDDVVHGGDDDEDVDGEGDVEGLIGDAEHETLASHLRASAKRRLEEEAAEDELLAREEERLARLGRMQSQAETSGVNTAAIVAESEMVREARRLAAAEERRRHTALAKAEAAEAQAAAAREARERDAMRQLLELEAEGVPAASGPAVAGAAPVGNAAAGSGSGLGRAVNADGAGASAKGKYRIGRKKQKSAE